MNISKPFILRPVATTLLTMGLALAGMIAFGLLPVAPLPQVDFPTVVVQAGIPGASAETMAATVATPLERHLGTISGITQMTSQSSLGSTRVILVFDLNRDINGAERDVQAAINAARVDLPTTLRSNPTYRTWNPSDAPIMILSLTSDTLTRGQLYDAASTVLQQKLSQVKGIGEVTVGGSSLPAVRIELEPHALNHYGISLEKIRSTLTAANANRPKGMLEDAHRHWQINANDQASDAAQYQALVIDYKNGKAVTLSDVGEVLDSVEDVRNGGATNGKASIILILYKQPDANIIDTVDRVDALMPSLRAAIPAAATLKIAMDRTPTIRASLHDVEATLVIATALVILVVFLFLRKLRATLIPSVAVPVSLIGTFSVMYVLGYSLDNLSLMALTIATGFVVDDAIVVLENVTRHMEQGTPRLEAALLGAREVGFTVVSMSLSLVAVFIPILLMGGIIGRLFREFAVTLSVAVLISLVLSLTTTPMMCATLLRHEANRQPNRFYNALEAAFEWLKSRYRTSLTWALRHSLLMIFIIFAAVALNFYLYIIIPKGFFPQEDTGRLMAFVHADQAISFEAMSKKFDQYMKILQKDPNIATVTGFVQANSGRMFISLKPNNQRKLTATQIIDELRKKTTSIPGATLFLISAQDIHAGGRQSNAQYQYTLQSDNFDDLVKYAPIVEKAFKKIPQLVDVNSDLQDDGLQEAVHIDRNTASRLGVTTQLIDATLYDAFGQRQVSVIYGQKNQYHVIMEVAPKYWQNPETLKDIYVPASANTASTKSTNGAAITNGAVVPHAISAGAISSGTNALGQFTTNGLVPLSAFATFKLGTTILSVNHQSQFAAITLSFNLPSGVTLSQATAAINDALVESNLPSSIHGGFAGTAQLFQSSLSTMPWLVLLALITIYIVLGVLYESYVHPLTILSTLPSAGVGALLSLFLCQTEFSIMALIGVILLIGIVKKNAIMIIDVAVSETREKKASAHDAIYEACLLRFRPILMTTMAAMLSALPLAIGTGTGSELRRPLGITIVGGLIVSQLLTLYTTPVVYLYMERFRLWCQKHWLRLTAGKISREESEPDIA